jgi:hypothetical protein
MPVAVTDIKHGYIDSEGENQFIYVSAGDDTSTLPDDAVADLIELGSVVESLTQDDRQRMADLEAEVEQLQAELAAATSQPQSTAPNDVLDTGAPKENAGDEPASVGEPTPQV